MSNIIKLKFTSKGEPYGREYTYFTPVEVKVGDLVEVEATSIKNGAVRKAVGIVTQIDVPEEEIAPFKDKAKTIIGLFKEEE